MGSEKKAVPITCLVLRLLTLVLLAISTYLIATDNVTYSFGGKTLFKDLIGYRYVLATSSIGLFYTLLQTPFAIYLVCTEKRTEGVKHIINFSIYGDMVIALLVATGVGAGFAVTIDTRRLVHQMDPDVITEEVRSKLDDYFKKAYIATGFLFLGFLCMATTSVIYSVTRMNGNRRGIFG